MSKKVLIIISSIVIVAIGVVSGIWIAVKANEPDKQYVAEKVTDECTEEYEKYKDEEPIVTNAIEERLTPNSKLILKKYYTSCKHTIEENVELPKELVNMSEKEMQKQYPDWEVIGFNSDEAILYKEVEGVCNEHFKITIENNRIVVYKLNNEGKEELYEITNITTEYLPETDLISIKNGLEIYGLSELNKVLEDFE